MQPLAESRPRRVPILPALTMVIAGVVVALLCAEVVLRTAGFSFRTFPTVQFGYPTPVLIRDLFVADRDLFWVTHDYSATLAQARQTHPAIVFMGDSCTQFGSYPTLTLTRLGAHAPTLATGVKLGVVGWSSEQGLAQLRRDVLPLRPRVITVYYGWNDHWVALGAPDADARPNAAVWWLSQHSRVWQLVSKARQAAAVRPEGRPNRVDVHRYESNLEAMVRLAAEHGTRTVLITAPSGHQRGHEPAYLALRHVRRLDEVVPLHQEYVAATRSAAQTSGAVLCDAAAAFDRDPSRATYFERDGIHLTFAGNRALADLLTPCILRAVSADTAQSRWNR